MSPSQTSQPPIVRQPEPVKLHALQTSQPPALQPMNPNAPHQERNDDLRLRGGGDRDGPCPGTFCFIPCPIPCNCFIIPCPC
ncbi:hypothetical protein VTK26DRAFT_7743 [Humicola hyalothermophila]